MDDEERHREQLAKQEHEQRLAEEAYRLELHEEEHGLEITKSSGNVFDDLELDNADELLAKAKAADTIEEFKGMENRDGVLYINGKLISNLNPSSFEFQMGWDDDGRA